MATCPIYNVLATNLVAFQFLVSLLIEFIILNSIKTKYLK